MKNFEAWRAAVVILQSVGDVKPLNLGKLAGGAVAA